MCVCVYVLICMHVLKKSLQFVIAVILHKCSYVFKEHLKSWRILDGSFIFKGDVYVLQEPKSPAVVAMLCTKPQWTLSCILTGEKHSGETLDLFSLRLLTWWEWLLYCCDASLSMSICTEILWHDYMEMHEHVRHWGMMGEWTTLCISMHFLKELFILPEQVFKAAKLVFRWW